MSECVVRIEFRKNCLDCDLHLILYGNTYADTDVYCFKTKRFVGKRFGQTKDLARPSWCPIICQLPEGHGRLVDADILRDKLIEHIAETNRFYHAFNETPTIVLAERSETCLD